MLNKNFGTGAGAPSGKPGQFGAKLQPQKIQPAEKYAPPYKQPDYRTGPQEIKPWQKASDMPGMGSGFLTVLKAMKKQKIAGITAKGPVPKQAPGGNAPKPFLKRGEIREELKKQTMGASLAEKEKIIPQKYGAYVTKSEIKRTERELHKRYLKEGGVKLAKQERILKSLEKKLK